MHVSRKKVFDWAGGLFRQRHIDIIITYMYLANECLRSVETWMYIVFHNCGLQWTEIVLQLLFWSFMNRFQVVKYDFKAKCVFLALMVRRVILACSDEVIVSLFRRIYLRNLLITYWPFLSYSMYFSVCSNRIVVSVAARQSNIAK